MRYFNRRVQTSTVEDLITVYLLAGWSLDSLLKIVKGKEVGQTTEPLLDGIDPKVTLSSISKYERKYGAGVDPQILGYPRTKPVVRDFNWNPITDIGHLHK
jgi:hypothetical protein